MADAPKQNATDKLIPNSGTPKPAPSSGQGSGTPPLKPKMGDTPENPSDKRLRRGLLITALGVGFLFIAILVIAVLSSGQGSNVILEQIGVKGDINEVLLKVVNFVFGIAGIIALISLVIGGFIYVVSMGNPKEMKRARRILIISAVTLVFLLLVYILIYALVRSNEQQQDQTTPQELVKIITNPDPASGPAPLMVGFDIANLGTGNYFYSWDFGDQTTGTGKPISHEYKEEGQYIVKVTISSGSNVVSELNTNVTVNNTRPKAVIDADPVSGVAPLEVHFDASRSEDPRGELTGYTWDFGDVAASTDNPNTGTGEKAVHTYSKNGIFNVTLTVTDNNGDTGSTTQQITVGAEPNAPIAVITTTPAATGFAPLTVQGIVPFLVNFSGSKSSDPDGEIKTYKWDFGDGSPSQNSQAVNHTYTQPGTYEALLTVTDNTDKKSTAKIRVIVGTPDQMPKAVITSTPPPTQNGEIRKAAPFTIQLDGSKSTDPDGEIVLYEWNMGDNSPLLNGPTVEYTYNTPGTYTLSLTVTDNDGYTNLQPATIKVIVSEAGPQNPVAIIKTDPENATGNVPFTVQFDGSESYDIDGTILSYEWDFGDGRSILSGAEVTHVYESPGIFTVTLTVHDNTNRTGETSVPVAAHVPAPIARIETNRDSGTAPVTIRFDGSSSSGDIKRYDWDFDDGSSARGREVQHTFSLAGDYTVELIVTDTVEQVDTETVVITVH